MDFTEAWDETCSTVGQACRAGDATALRAFLADGRRTDVGDNRGWRPLHEAAARGHLDCVRAVCAAADADVNWKTFEGESALVLAARGGHADVCLCLLLHGAACDAATAMNESPLQVAAAAGHVDCIRLFLDHGAPLDAADFSGETALHAAVSGGYASAVGVLLRRGADLSSADCHGRTPLFVAAQHGRASCMRLCRREALRRGVDTLTLVEAATADGTTPLMMAAQAGAVRCVRQLLQWGADVNRVTDDCVMALHLAVVGASARCVSLLLRHTDRRVLRSCSWDPRCRAEDLACACRSCAVGLRRALPEHARVGPFHLAVGSRPVLQLLLLSDLDPNDFLQRTADDAWPTLDSSSPCPFPEPLGATALAVAVQRRDLEALRALLRAGCRADPDSPFALSALALAAARPWHRGARLLIRHGADANFPSRLRSDAHPLPLLAAARRRRMMALLRRNGGDLRLLLGHHCAHRDRVLRPSPPTLDFFCDDVGAQNLDDALRRFGYEDVADDLRRQVSLPLPLKRLAANAVRRRLLDARPLTFAASVAALALPAALQFE